MSIDYRGLRLLQGGCCKTRKASVFVRIPHRHFYVNVPKKLADLHDAHTRVVDQFGCNGMPERVPGTLGQSRSVTHTFHGNTTCLVCYRMRRIFEVAENEFTMAGKLTELLDDGDRCGIRGYYAASPSLGRTDFVTLHGDRLHDV